MYNPSKLLEEVDLFYSDIIKVIEERVLINKKKFEQYLQKEENLQQEIINIEKKIKEINDIPKNHINENIQYYLLPEYYKKVDKFKKDIYYLNQELEALHKYNEEERKELSSDNEKYIDRIDYYYNERNEIIKSIINKEILKDKTQNFINYQQISELRNQNDAIFSKYLPNIKKNISSDAAPPTNGNYNNNININIYNRP